MTALLLLLYVAVLPSAVWLAYRIGFTRGERAEFKKIVSGIGGLSVGGYARVDEVGRVDPEGPLTASVVFPRDRH